MKMTHSDFCFWLKGFFDSLDLESKEHPLNEYQGSLIRKYLQYVFEEEKKEPVVPVVYSAYCSGSNK